MSPGCTFPSRGAAAPSWPARRSRWRPRAERPCEYERDKGRIFFEKNRQFTVFSHSYTHFAILSDLNLLGHATQRHLCTDSTTRVSRDTRPAMCTWKSSVATSNDARGKYAESPCKGIRRQGIMSAFSPCRTQARPM